jgi:transcriptional regulator with PAS, ATPase and Fis domain
MDIQAVQSIKQRFGIIGNNEALNRAIDVARQVASTDLSVLITGPSGSGKENFPQIIHQFSSRKHNNYIAVNCGAIPEGTIDSELFGHEKGSFTGATDNRKGYFEVADGGTIFLDEVGELPLSTQVRLLRVLETGEFIKVGSSKIQKTNVRVVAATNVDLVKAIYDGKFREDLYYRLNTVPIIVPPLCDRKEDIYLLFRKFASDFGLRYRMPAISLTDGARRMLEEYSWPGNVRQLKNVTEQISVIEQERTIDELTISRYLPDMSAKRLPVIMGASDDAASFASEREILYKILFDMKNDMNDLKKLVHDLMQKGVTDDVIHGSSAHIVQKFYNTPGSDIPPAAVKLEVNPRVDHHIQDTEEIVEESLSIGDKEEELIRKALAKHGGKRKLAAEELGISERTLYRKIKELNIS